MSAHSQELYEQWEANGSDIAQYREEYHRDVMGGEHGGLTWHPSFAYRVNRTGRPLRDPSTSDVGEHYRPPRDTNHYHHLLFTRRFGRVDVDVSPRHLGVAIARAVLAQSFGLHSSSRAWVRQRRSTKPLGSRIRTVAGAMQSCSSHIGGGVGRGRYCTRAAGALGVNLVGRNGPS